MQKDKNIRLQEYWKKAVEVLIAEHGVGYQIKKNKLVEYMKEHFGITPGSVTPQDYSYNRMDDNKMKHPESFPQLLEMVGGGYYRCLGLNYIQTMKLIIILIYL